MSIVDKRAPALPQTEDTITPAEFAGRFTHIADSIERVIRGKRDVIELALVCLLAEGHLLIEDVPGVGKTTLARCLSAAIGGRLQRIQFTPDLLPSDVVGVSIFHPDTQTFQFHPGPVFANIVLGDEINRASPKTQSALLEVMEERTVTVDGHSRVVPRPFMVIATQNPIEMGGTYPLPEAQLDRFLMRVSVGYPDRAAEVTVMRGGQRHPVACGHSALGRGRAGGDRRDGRARDGDPRRGPALRLRGPPGRVHPRRSGPTAGCLAAGERGTHPGRPGPGGRLRPGVCRSGRRQGAGRPGALAPAAAHPRG